MIIRLRIKQGLLLILLGMSSIQITGCAGVGRGAAAAASGDFAVPAMPSNVAATPGNAQVTLTWNPSANATSYHVKRATTSGGPFTLVAAPAAASYSDAPLANGNTYFYAVSALGKGGESPNSSPVTAKPTAIASVTSVTVTPATASAATSGALSFTATVKATNASTSVTWKAALGKITSSGQYTAPSSVGTDTVTATSVADSTKAASVAVKITPAATPPPPAQLVSSVAITPASASLATSGTFSFTATVQGTTSNKSVTWKAALGKITASGLYTAPSSAGTDTVLATSVADTDESCLRLGQGLCRAASGPNRDLRDGNSRFGVFDHFRHPYIHGIRSRHDHEQVRDVEGCARENYVFGPVHGALQRWNRHGHGD